MNRHQHAAIANISRFLTFQLGKEEYGVSILAVREIIGVIAITPLPRAPRYVRGVINLRGKIIPVIDLRSRLGMPSIEPTPHSCIIVVEMNSITGVGTCEVGVIVDEVREVLDLPLSGIEVRPECAGGPGAEMVTGIGKLKERVVILLEVGKLVEASDIGLGQSEAA